MEYRDFEELEGLFHAQDSTRWELASSSAAERIAKLKSLRKAIVSRQQEFYDAIWEDFHKSKAEAWLCEVFPTLEEIDFTVRHLKKWMKDKPVKGVFFLPTAKSYSRFEPKGHVLIMAPWNYPFLLLLEPIVSAVAAGNVVMAKTSHKTPKVSKFLASLLEEVFPPSEVAIIEGEGVKIGDALLELPFDHVFFTGSPEIGKKIAEKAARIHASVTLELGGKSPVVILDDSDLSGAANKIAWGKTLNAGQTCIAPDYVLCPRAIADKFADFVKIAVEQMFGGNENERAQNPDFVHIVNSQAVDRHERLINDALSRGARQILGGKCDRENRITPITILTGVTPDMEIMQSEIFGPILPIMAYDSLDQAIDYIQKNPKPLSLYIFGKGNDGSQGNLYTKENPGDEIKNRKKGSAVSRLLKETSAGSTCIDNVIIQIENLNVPFGGVGRSGSGNYHGFYGFKAFSHERNIMRQRFFDVIRIFHAPYVHGNKANGIRLKAQRIATKLLRIIKGF